MQTLSHGFKKPQTGDKQFWGALEDNIQQTNDHSHNGVDSKRLTSSAVSSETQDIPAGPSLYNGEWVAEGSGFSKTVTIQAINLKFDDYGLVFRDANTHKPMYLDYEKITDSSFKVFCNDNTVDLIVFYVS